MNIIQLNKPFCPKCKETLWFEQLQGMRLFKVIGRFRIYNAICNACKKHFQCRGINQK